MQATLERTARSGGQIRTRTFGAYRADGADRWTATRSAASGCRASAASTTYGAYVARAAVATLPRGGFALPVPAAVHVSTDGRIGTGTASAVQAPLDGQAMAMRWSMAMLAFILVWSVSYLGRQPGVAEGPPYSFLGSFALEGAALALAWLALLITGCVAVLSGVVELRDPRDG